MYKTLILEDEAGAMNVLQTALKNYSELRLVAACRDLASARTALARHRPDIVFLDIMVEGQKVFPLVEELWRNGQTPAIIFVTAYAKDHLEEATASCEQLFQWSYLMKPVRDEKLAHLIRRFRAVRERRGEALKPLVVRSGQREYLVAIADIVYCESDGNYVNLYEFQDGRLVKRVWSGSLSGLLKDELSISDIVRISSKHAINRSYLRGSADRRASCELAHEDLPKTIKLRVPENRRKAVWGELLG